MGIRVNTAGRTRLHVDQEVNELRTQLKPNVVSPRRQLFHLQVNVPAHARLNVKPSRSMMLVQQQTVELRARRAPVILKLLRQRPTLESFGLQGPAGPAGPPGPAGGADASFVAAHALSGHRVVYRLPDLTVGYASNDDAGTVFPVAGVTTQAAQTGEQVLVRRSGLLTFNGWSWTPGAPVFLGSDGFMTQSAPSQGVLVDIGVAHSATTLDIRVFSPAFLVED